MRSFSTLYILVPRTVGRKPLGLRGTGGSGEGKARCNRNPPLFSLAIFLATPQIAKFLTGRLVIITEPKDIYTSTYSNT